MKKLTLKLTLMVPDYVVKTNRDGTAQASDEVIADYILELKNGTKLINVEKIDTADTASIIPAGD